MAGKIFVSFRRDGAGQELLRRLLDSLRSAFQPEQLVLGVDSFGPEFYVDRLGNRVRECDVFLAVIGDWRDEGKRRLDPQDHVRIEIEEALRQSKPVIPVLLGEVPIPRPSALPEPVRSLPWQKARRLASLQFNTDVQALIAALQEALAGLAVDPAPSAAPLTSSAPEIPEQGYGPHFEIGDDGVVTLAPPAALDRQGNNIDRLRRMHPELRDLSKELAHALAKGNIPHIYLLERARAYHQLINQELDHIDFSLLYMAGVRLANAEKAAAGDGELPPLAVPVRETIDSLLRFHGVFMLATREGLEAIAAEERYRRTQQEEVEFRKAAIDLAQNLQNQPSVVDAKAVAVVRNAAEEIGRGSNPERSGTVAAGVLKNVTVAIATGAAIGAIPLAAVATGSTMLLALAGPAGWIATEALKRSKSFSALAALITRGIDKVAETELSDALAKVRALLAPQVRFLLSAKEQLGRLAGRSDEFKWLTRTVRWVEQEVETTQLKALPPAADVPREPPREVQPPPPPPEPSLLGNIYLGRITTIEPSLQAAFVEYGSDRHGFLPFNEIHPDYYQIPVAERQRLIDERARSVSAELRRRESDRETVDGAENELVESTRDADGHRYKIRDVIKRRQVVLVQIIKEARDNRGAVLTTNLSLPGRFLVLMPNSAGVAAVSRKITEEQDRERLMNMIRELQVPDGMGIVLREAAASRSQSEVENDLGELIARWDALRDLTLKSNPPALVYDASAHEPALVSDPGRGMAG